MLRACLERSYFACEPPDHQLDHGDSDPRFGRFGQGVEVLTQSARAVEPAEGAFDDPAPLQDPKFLALPRPFHDRKGALQNSGYPINQLAGVTPVCPNELQPRKAGDQRFWCKFQKRSARGPGRLGERESLACKIGPKSKLCTRTRGADLLFQVISQRYERGSIILTSNKAFKQWPAIFNGDSTITSAVLDRLLHHAETILIEGSSYRMKDRIEP